MKQLAFINKVKYGYIDHQGIRFSFDVMLLDGGERISIPIDILNKFMTDNYIEDISWFERKACIVDSEGVGSLIRFVKFLMI